jgi:hypothetical protein
MELRKTDHLQTLAMTSYRLKARDLKPSIFERRPSYFNRAGASGSHREAGRLRLRAAAEVLLEPGREDEGEEPKFRPGPCRLN